MSFDFDESRYQKMVCYHCRKEWLGSGMMMGRDPVCNRYACKDCIAEGLPHDSHQESIDRRKQQRERVLASINPEDPFTLIAAALHLIQWLEEDQTVQFEPEWGQVGRMLEAHCKAHPTATGGLLRGVKRLWAYSEKPKSRETPAPGTVRDEDVTSSPKPRRPSTSRVEVKAIVSVADGTPAPTSKKGRTGSPEVFK